jgi:hypothetical protein
MKEESRIVELLSEMLFKFDVLTEHVDVGFNNLGQRVGGLEQQMSKVEQQMGKVESEIVKLNLLTSEHSRSLMKLADNHERITRLEKAVFK